MYNGSYQSYGQGSFPQPPANNYGSHMQPAPLYQAPPPANVQYYQQQQPDPAIQIATDPNAFAQMFKAQLASLTFNSKPIITNVTILSHEHMQRMSQVVARCLEEHVLSVSISSFVQCRSICMNSFSSKSLSLSPCPACHLLLLSLQIAFHINALHLCSLSPLLVVVPSFIPFAGLVYDRFDLQKCGASLHCSMVR
jgi:hypothetical protein